MAGPSVDDGAQPEPRRGDRRAPASETLEHYHPAPRSCITSSPATAGCGSARRTNPTVIAGDCVVIPPGTPHKLWNTGTEPLVLLCCCAPAYSDDDTVMTGR